MARGMRRSSSQFYVPLSSYPVAAQRPYAHRGALISAVLCLAPLARAASSAHFARECAQAECRMDIGTRGDTARAFCNGSLCALCTPTPAPGTDLIVTQVDRTAPVAATPLFASVLDLYAPILRMAPAPIAIRTHSPPLFLALHSFLI